MRRLATVAVLAAALLLATVGPVTAAPDNQSGNLLSNGGFETGGGSAGTASWLPWWSEEAKPADGSFNYAYKPSWNQESLSAGAASAFIFSGNSSQRVINNWDPWYAGVKQVVSAPAGARVRLTVYGRAYAASAFYPEPTDASVNAQMRVGIEPNGSENQFSSTVVWSAPMNPHAGWQAASVEATVGAGGQVAVILSADFRGSSRLFLTTFWDEASLVVVSTSPAPTATATTAPTNPPPAQPTATTGGSSPAPAPTATPAPPPAPSSNTASTVYVVRRGDTLYAIATRYKVTIAAITRANGIVNANLIYAGQRLVIPGVGSSSGGSTTPPSSGGSTVYIVQRGDTLYRIGLKYGVSVDALKSANRLTSNLIYPGQRLLIPSAAAPTPAPTTAPAAPPPPAATAVPVAPTATPAPPPVTAVPQTTFSSRGIVSTYFRVENAAAGANQDIWFNWDFTNTTDGPVFFSVLAPHSDAGPNAQSWTNFSLGAHQRIDWRDHMNIGQPGTYQVYLGVCYGDKNACLANQAEWERLSNSITITVN